MNGKGGVHGNKSQFNGCERRIVGAAAPATIGMRTTGMRSRVGKAFNVISDQRGTSECIFGNHENANYYHRDTGNSRPIHSTGSALLTVPYPVWIFFYSFYMD